MNIGLNALANFYFSQASYMETRTGGAETAKEYFEMADRLYGEALSSHPDDVETLLNICITRTRLYALRCGESRAGGANIQLFRRNQASPPLITLHSSQLRSRLTRD